MTENFPKNATRPQDSEYDDNKEGKSGPNEFLWEHHGGGWSCSQIK